MAYVHYAAAAPAPVYRAVYPATVPVAVPDAEHAAKAAELATKDMQEKVAISDAHQKLAALSREEYADAEAARGAEARAAAAQTAAEAAKERIESSKEAVAPAEERAKAAEEAVAPAQEKAARAKEAAQAQGDECAAKRGAVNATMQERVEHDLSPRRVRYVSHAAPPVVYAAHPFGGHYVAAAPSAVYAVPDADHASKAVELWNRDMKERTELGEADSKRATLMLDEYTARREAEAAEAAAQAARAEAEAAAKAVDDAPAEADAAAERAAAAADEAKAAAEKAEASKAAAQAQRDECAQQCDANSATARERVEHDLSPQRVRYVHHAVAAPVVYSSPHRVVYASPPRVVYSSITA